MDFRKKKKKILETKSGEKSNAFTRLSRGLVTVTNPISKKIYFKKKEKKKLSVTLENKKSGACDITVVPASLMNTKTFTWCWCAIILITNLLDEGRP